MTGIFKNTGGEVMESPGGGGFGRLFEVACGYWRWSDEVRGFVLVVGIGIAIVMGRNYCGFWG